MEKHKRYSVGIYCRLSKDDDTAGGGDSSSISSQKQLLEKYVKENGWKTFDFYTDDGFSGTNFNRPDFERMIDDVEDGKINMVVVKDLSRLGRNYLLTGHYTEIYFPEHQVRFIAVNDNIDTINSDNDIAPFKNILNEMYAKDISRKVRSAVKVKKQNGEFLGNHAPFGYIKSPDNKNKLIIEESGANVVRRIFEMCKLGFGSVSIAKALNKEGVLSPIDHLNVVCPNYFKTEQRKHQWSPESILSILKNRVYVGELRQGVYDCSRFKRTPNKRKSSDEWIVVENMHEPIIDIDIWDQAQKCLLTRKRELNTNELQLFAGFVKCMDCGYSLGYNRKGSIENYTCATYRRHGTDSCLSHYIRKDLLEKVVLDDICKYAFLVKEDEEAFTKDLLSVKYSKDEKQLDIVKAEIKSAKTRYAEVDKILKCLYEDNVNGKISDNRFAKMSTDYENEQEILEKQIDKLENSIDKMMQDKQDISYWLKLIKKHSDITKLDRTVLSELVEKIVVGNQTVIDGKRHQNIIIYYKFVGNILH